MKHTIQWFIHWEKPWREGDHGFKFDACDMSDYGYVMVQPASVEIDIPDDFDPRPAQIKALQEKQKQAMADFQKLSTDIMRQIQELQALEMTA